MFSGGSGWRRVIDVNEPAEELLLWTGWQQAGCQEGRAQTQVVEQLVLFHLLERVRQRVDVAGSPNHDFVGSLSTFERLLNDGAEVP